MDYYYSYILYMLPAMLLAIWAQMSVKSTFSKYQKIGNSRGMSGSDAARAIGLSRRGGRTGIARGGSWYSFADSCRSARRLDLNSNTRQNNIGFRIVITQR